MIWWKETKNVKKSRQHRKFEVNLNYGTFINNNDFHTPVYQKFTQMYPFLLCRPYINYESNCSDKSRHLIISISCITIILGETVNIASKYNKQTDSFVNLGISYWNIHY